MNNKFVYYLILCSMVLVSILLSHIPTYAGIIFAGDYESGNFAAWQEGGRCCNYSSRIVTSPVRTGKYAARYELRYSDPKAHNGKRSEVRYGYKGNKIGKIGGPDEWYGFSTYFPPGYEPDYAQECVAQWHAQPDTGEKSRSPVLTFNTGSGEWLILARHSSKPIQTSNDGTRVTLWRSPYQTGVWIDWVVHVKWSYQSDGFTEIWKDGVKILDYKGPNAYNDKKNIYWKWGIYKWPWNNNQPTDVTKRVVYNDEFRIGDSNSSYAEVAPRNPDTTPPANPTLNIAVSK